MDKIIIGIDLGGTNLRIGAVTSKNEILFPSVMKSSVIANADVPIIKLCEIISEYKIKNNIQEIEAISIGVPSSVENDKETVICTTNIRNQAGKAVFENYNMACKIREYFQVPVFINNDINNIMTYDISENHLEKKKSVVGIYIGTGVGASVAIDGKFLEGKNGAELDLGHIPYLGGKKQCGCGKKGCCECYASGWALQEIRQKFYPETDIKDMFVLHRNEKPLKEFVEACANIYAIMATIFNPDVIIVGGGVMEMDGFPQDEFEAKVNGNTGKDVMMYGFDYVYSKAFMGKGVIGAALFAKKQLKNRNKISC